MTLLTIGLAVAVLALAAIVLYDRLEQDARRRDRLIVRRIQQYLDALPPARPW